MVKAEKERAVSDIEYRELTQRYLQVQEEHRMLEKKLKRNIERSKLVLSTICHLKHVCLVEGLCTKQSITQITFKVFCMC